MQSLMTFYFETWLNLAAEWRLSCWVITKGGVQKKVCWPGVPSLSGGWLVVCSKYQQMNPPFSVLFVWLKIIYLLYLNNIDCSKLSHEPSELEMNGARGELASFYWALFCRWENYPEGDKGCTACEWHAGIHTLLAQKPHDYSVILNVIKAFIPIWY